MAQGSASSSRFYEWSGKNQAGKSMRGAISATSDTDARTQLQKQGIHVTGLTRSKGLVTVKKNPRRIKPRDIANFTRQLAVMLRAGVSLLQAFDLLLQGESNPRMVKLLSAIRTDIASGNSLNRAMRKHPVHFNTLYCDLIAAGETAGILDNILERLAMYQEKSLALQAKVKKAMFYPAMIVLASVLAISVIMMVVIPKFKELFSGFGAELPVPTQIVINIADWLATSGWWQSVLIIFGGYFFFRSMYRSSHAFHYRVDGYLLRIPLIGNIQSKAAIARWTRTLSTMFAAGIPLVDALKSVAGAAGNLVFENGSMNIAKSVSVGETMAISMQRSLLFPPLVFQMVAIGESSGALDQMLARVADLYDEEVSNAVDSMTAMMEPLILMVLGPIIGAIIIAMYLPIFNLASVVGG